MADFTASSSGDVRKTETDRLIASDQVEGTGVYNRQGEHLGEVHNFMVDKRSGQVAYAVMSFGGFLGMAENYHPLPWKVLDYDPSQGGFVVDLDKEMLEGAPTFSRTETPSWSDTTYTSRIDNFYDVTADLLRFDEEKTPR